MTMNKTYTGDTTLEVNSNTEWLRVYSHVDFDEIDDVHEDDAARTFTDSLHVALWDVGFETESAKGQRTLLHGWHGFNLFRHKIGPVGTFGDLADDDIDLIENAINLAESKMRETWIDR